MKLIVAICVILFFSTTFGATGDPVIFTGPEFERYFHGGMQGTWILFFYNKSAPAYRTEKLRKEVDDKIMKVYDGFHYQEMDGEAGTWNDVIEMLKVDETELKHSPTVMVASEGLGYWSHGEGCVDEIVYKIPEYAAEIRRKQ